MYKYRITTVPNKVSVNKLPIDELDFKGVDNGMNAWEITSPTSIFELLRSTSGVVEIEEIVTEGVSK